MNVVNRLLEGLNSSSLNDSAAIKQDGSNSGGDEVQVIIRKVVSDKERKPNKEDVSDEILIETGESEYPEVGNAVTLKGEAVEDGVYEFEGPEGEMSCYVEGGVIAAIGDEAISDLTKTVIQGGRKVKKTVRTVKKRLSAAQKQALVKARKKAFTGSAKKARLKSFKKGLAMGLHNNADGSVDISSVDLNALGDSLYAAVFAALSDRYELDAQTIDKLEEMLSEDICKPVVDGNVLKFTVPVWTEMNDEVDLENFDLAELSYDLKGTFDSDLLLNVLTDGDIQMQTSLIV